MYRHTFDSDDFECGTYAKFVRKGSKLFQRVFSKDSDLLQAGMFRFCSPFSIEI